LKAGDGKAGFGLAGALSLLYFRIDYCCRRIISLIDSGQWRCWSLLSEQRASMLRRGGCACVRVS
ncbi:MAG: hypothetical protein ACKPE6_16025, partial [Gammaproteobacteria bacterium]